MYFSLFKLNRKKNLNRNINRKPSRKTDYDRYSSVHCIKELNYRDFFYYILLLQIVDVNHLYSK